MGRSSAAPLQDRPDSQKWLSHLYRCPFLCGGAVTFFVFFAGAAGTGVVAPDLCAGAHGLGRFGLGGTGLILQIFLLALLFALELARYFRQTLRTRFARAGGGAGYGGLRAT